MNELRFDINLLDDGQVVTRDGEFLGTWDTDETDAFYQFTPDGETEHVCMDLYRGPLCDKIRRWLEAR